MKVCNKRRQKVIEQLVSSLKDKDSSVRQAVAEMLVSMGWKPQNLEEQTACFIAFNKWEELIKIGAPVVAPILSLLDDEDLSIRENAVRALGVIGDVRAVEPLTEIIKVESAPLIRSAFKAFKESVNSCASHAKKTIYSYCQFTSAVATKASPAGTSMATACVNQKQSLEFSAIKALGRIGDPRSVGPLLSIVKHKNGEAQKYAFKALYRIGARGIAALCESLKDKEPFVRGAAAMVIGRIGDTRALKPLNSLVKDKDASVRKSVAKAFGQIGGNLSVRPLLLLLGDRDAIVREAAAESLGGIRDVLAIGPLFSSLKDKESFVRESAAKALGRIKDHRAVKALIPLLQDKEPFVRISVIRSLGNIGEASAVEPLIRALRDKSKYVRFAAIDALGEIGDYPAVISLIDVLKNGETHYLKRLAAKTLKRVKRPYTVLPHKKNMRKEVLKKDHSIKLEQLNKLKGNFLPV